MAEQTEKTAEQPEVKEAATEELSPEDQELKDNLELLVTRLSDSQVSESALEMLRQEVRGATTSMTSVPKPLKFLQPHYDTIKEVFARTSAGVFKTQLANFLSVLGTTMAAEDSRESLSYLLQGDKADMVNWGQEYIRNLASDIRDEYNIRIKDNASTDELTEIINNSISYLCQHSSEADAVDLLAEVDELEKILPYVDIDNHKRICEYIAATSSYSADTYQMNKTLNVCFQAYLQVGKFPEALRIALKINDPELVTQAMTTCQDPTALKQMGYILGRHKYFYEVEDDDLLRIISNEHLNESFIRLATDLDVLDPKTPEDIYKSHLEDNHGRRHRAQIETEKSNLAATFVNAFVNVGFCNTINTEEEQKIYAKNKDSGLMSAVASIGMHMLWNVDEGLTKIDRFQHSNDDYVKAGAMMGIGLLSSGIKNEVDPAFALLTEHLDNASNRMRLGIIMGLSFAYAGSYREDVLEILTPLVIDTSIPLEQSAMAALTLGMVFVGTCNNDVAESIAQTLMERGENELSQPFAKFFCLGIGLVFLGQQDKVTTALDIIENLVQAPLNKFALVVANACAYAGSGSVLKLQEMLKIVSEHLEDEKDSAHQVPAVLACSLIAMGEEIGSEMMMRSFDHILQYGEINVKRIVPLAMALLCIGNPKIPVCDILTKLAHETDEELAQSAIFALGLVGAGTNNSRLAATLRGLASYYYKDANQLFVTRIAQGLVHLGKGLMTLQPSYSEKLLQSPVALGGLLTTLFAFIDINQTLHKDAHYLLFYLTCAIQPRMLVTLNEDGEQVEVSVRVGQAVDIVGQAGKPRAITGFQTHTTPVLIAHGERAELGTEEYIPATDILEHFVILKKNPDYEGE